MFNNELLALSLRKKFTDLFHREPLLVRAPGRVNLIGEHTDYNEGFVLPAAIDEAIIAAIGRRQDNEIHLYSHDFNEVFVTNLEKVERREGSWTNYVLGVVRQLQIAGKEIGGFNLLIGGEIPIGAGLSSSAAMECSVIQALNNLFELSIPEIDMVKMAQKAEHEFAQVNCGIMDQFASMFGRKGHAIKLDCRSLEFEYVPLYLRDYRIVLFNTNVSHSLASSQYNLRRQQCEEGVSLISANLPEVQSLRDAEQWMLDKWVAPVDEIIYRRCRYVIEENERLLKACEYLQAGDIEGLGRMMYASHLGLSKDYEVSCAELDLLVDLVKDNPDVAGARMMGGGFGGCTINLVKERAIGALAGTVLVAYNNKTGIDLGMIMVEADDGASVFHINKKQQA